MGRIKKLGNYMPLYAPPNLSFSLHFPSTFCLRVNRVLTPPLFCELSLSRLLVLPNPNNKCFTFSIARQRRGSDPPTSGSRLKIVNAQGKEGRK